MTPTSSPRRSCLRSGRRLSFGSLKDYQSTSVPLDVDGDSFAFFLGNLGPSPCDDVSVGEKRDRDAAALGRDTSDRGSPKKVAFREDEMGQIGARVSECSTSPPPFPPFPLLFLDTPPSYTHAIL